MHLGNELQSLLTRHDQLNELWLELELNWPTGYNTGYTERNMLVINLSMLLMWSHMHSRCFVQVCIDLCTVNVQYNKQRILQLENVRLQSVPDESSEYS